MHLTAKTLYGLEDMAVSELQGLGAKKLSKGNRVVTFEGDTELLYRANLCARTILRILVPISEFKAHNDRHLYQMAQKVSWQKYIGAEQTFLIDATVNGARFRHSHYAALKVKDAIVDQFKERTGDRPNINLDNPDVRINLHISEIDVTLSLDSSGESLEKRGYRTESNEAPISECLAAAMVLLSGWNDSTPLLDPMTGSGTIAIEAALFASNTPPGLFRRFGFQRWMDYDDALYQRIDHDLRTKIQAPKHQIVARDISGKNLSIAKRNAQRAAIIEHLNFKEQDARSSEPIADNAYVLMNPPYGERLEDEDDESMFEFYHEVGRQLKHRFAGNELWVISGNLKALKRLGLKPDRSYKVYNGPIECRLNGYSLFKGKRQPQGLQDD